MGGEKGIMKFSDLGKPSETQEYLGERQIPPKGESKPGVAKPTEYQFLPSRIEFSEIPKWRPAGR